MLCLGNTRHIEKRGNMKQDLNVIDAIVTGYETREEIEETAENSTYILKVQKQYENEKFSIVLTNAVLLNTFKNYRKS